MKIRTDLIAFDNEIRKEYTLNLISGSDEAGRGAMAGPIVVASVILPSDYENDQIRDSKKVPEKIREKLFDEITANAISWSVKIYSAAEVDKLNPKAASVMGMIASIKDLKPTPEISLIDGEKLKDETINSVQLIKGDDKSQAIAAASIIAKVTRDRMMIDYDHQYPGYNLAINKGYCTLDHQQRATELGILPIHRLTYAPIKRILDKTK